LALIEPDPVIVVVPFERKAIIPPLTPFQSFATSEPDKETSFHCGTR